MASHIKLFVFVQGLGCNCFPVTIERSETVGDLKKAILKKTPNTFKGVDACELTLYKVELPDDENLEQLAHQAEKEKLEFGTRQLSNIFLTDPPKMTVTILVVAPNFGWESTLDTKMDECDVDDSSLLTLQMNSLLLDVT